MVWIIIRIVVKIITITAAAALPTQKQSEEKARQVAADSADRTDGYGAGGETGVARGRRSNKKQPSSNGGNGPFCVGAGTAGGRQQQPMRASPAGHCRHSGTAQHGGPAESTKTRARSRQPPSFIAARPHRRRTSVVDDELLRSKSRMDFG